MVFMMLMPCIPAMAEDNISITIDGQAKVFDVMPVLINDRTMVPLRGIFETLGAEVGWDDATWTVTATKGETTVVLQIDNKTAKVNGKEIELDVPATLVSERTMVPVRFVSESLGCKVDWIDETQTVVITSHVKEETVTKTKAGELLDGKKVLFVGNSYVYYGNCVLPNGRTAYTWADRSEDKGYFYQLCKAHGAEVKVRNWCFSGHTIYNIFDGPCDHNIECQGVFHENHIEDKYFDYVFISPHAASGEETRLKESLAYVTDLFRQYNPDVKFVILGNHAVYGITNKATKFPGISESYKELEKEGFIIADWGSIVKDIVEGGVTPPGATMEYNKDTFVNAGDGYHENVLSGYLTALTAFCAITGEKAVGQPYEFCYDKSLGERFDLEARKKQYYGDKPTNFLEVFHSEKDMKALQKMVDWLFM